MFFDLQVIGPAVPVLARLGVRASQSLPVRLPEPEWKSVSVCCEGSQPLWARAVGPASRATCRSVDCGNLDGGVTLKSVRGDLGRLNTSRCEICGQAEHLNVWRSNATSNAGSPRCSTCMRRI